MASETTSFVAGLPKAEIHVHLEGSLEPEFVVRVAARNGVAIPWKSGAELEQAFDFAGLLPFLDVLFACCEVLRTEEDYYEAAIGYLRRARADNVIHAELFVDVQGGMQRGVDVAAQMTGVLRAFRTAERELGMTVGLLVIGHRHRPESEAFAMLDAVMPWADSICGFGLGGPELGFPPSGFQRFFAECRKRGFKTLLHSGEEGPADYVRETVELLGVDRIDHGNASIDDLALVREIARRGIPLTLCPLSNLRLNVVPSLTAHPLKQLLDAGVCVTVNSDDPTFFGGYMNANLIAVQEALGLSDREIAGIVRNGFSASFLPEQRKLDYLEAFDRHLAATSISP